MIISHLKLNGILQPEIVSEQMINGLICDNFTFYRTLIGVHIWWAKLFKAVLILLIAISLFELLAPAGFGIMCLLLLLKKIYLFYLVSLSFAAIYYVFIMWSQFFFWLFFCIVLFLLPIHFPYLILIFLNLMLLKVLFWCPSWFLRWW